MGPGERVALITGSFAVAVALIQTWRPAARKIAELEATVKRLTAKIIRMGGDPDAP